MSHRAPSSSAVPDRDLHPQARELLRELIARTRVFFAERESNNLRLVRGHLRQLLDDPSPHTPSQNLRSAHMMLEIRQHVFVQAFRNALHTTLEEEAQLALPDAPAHPAQQHGLPADPMQGMSLSLVDMSEVDRIMMLDRVALRFNQHHEASLGALTERLGALLHLQAPSLARNPFRPDVYVRSFMQAWDMGGFDPQARDDLLLSLQPHHTVDLGTLYVELDALLAEAGIAAKPALRIKRDAVQPAATLPPMAAIPSAPAAKKVTPLETSPHALVQIRQTITAKARQFLQQIGWASGPKVYTGTIPTLWPPVDVSLLGYLGDLQACAGAAVTPPVTPGESPSSHNILHKMRDLPEIRRAPELDRGTVDALAEVFDFVFADQEIPVQMKYIIGRLQIPVLKAAMIDRDFFFSNDHPARRLVDTLAHAAIGWAPEKGETDPLYAQIEQTVKRVLTEFEDDLDLFRDLLRQFTEFLFETEQQAQAAFETEAQQERDREAVGQALIRADQAVHECINAQSHAQPLAKFLVPFLTHPWRDVLIQASLSAHAQAWTQALDTMHQLIWSTQPKTRVEQRRELVALLPSLVRNLNKSLDAIEWQGEARATFTRRLITTHMLAIRLTQAPATDAGAQALEERASTQAMQELDARLAQHLSRSDDKFDRIAQGLTRGLWFDFIMEDGQPHRCLLSWVSPMRTRLLFTNREGLNAFVRSEREVAALLRLQRLRIVDHTPIVSRALRQIMTDPQEKLAA